MKINYKYLISFIILFLIEAFIAIFIKDNIIRPFVGDVLVVILIYTFLKIFITKPIKYLPIYIFLFACLVEIGQYFDLVSLLHLQNFKLARIILGSTFDIKDIICYLIGTIFIIVINTINSNINQK